MFERNALGARARKMKIQYSNVTLKIIAAVLTLIGTIGVAVFQNGVLKLENYSTQSLLEAFNSDSGVFGLATVVILCSGIAAFSVPVYSLLMIEGYKHTSSLKHYVLRVGLLALISEIPYDLAMRKSWFDMDSQNPVIGMLIVLMMLYFLKYVEKIQKVKGFLVKMAIVLAAVLWTILLNVYCGTAMVLVTAMLWLLEGNGAFTTFMAATVSLIKFPAPFGFVFNHFYNGEKGNSNRWFFYAFYPLHLLILGLIGMYCF